MSSLLEMQAAYDDTRRVLSIMKLAKRDDASLASVRCGVFHGEIIIPKRYRSVVMKLFKEKSVKTKLVGEEFNEWLKKFLHTQVLIGLPLPDISNVNYNDLFKFLIEGKTTLNNLQNQLYNQCVYGYYLELFYQTYVVEHLSGRVPQNFKVILKENFDISESYGCKLRWLGKLWNEYSKIGQLSMRLHQFYSYRQQVDNLFHSFPHLAKEWKTDQPQPEPSNHFKFSSTNPFLVDMETNN